MPANVTNPPTPTEQPAHLIDVQEVARRLGISDRTVWRLNSAGKLPKPITIGQKSKRWRADEIAAWVEAGCPDRKAWEKDRAGRMVDSGRRVA
jgi:excisionase family DNA binding protein